MTHSREKTKSPGIPELEQEIKELRTRLEEARSALNAIRSGEVDTLIVSGPKGEQIYNREGANKVYRLFVEAMSEGAVALDAGYKILYCNQKFSLITGLPAEKITGKSFLDFIDSDDTDFVRERIMQHSGHQDPVELSLRRRSGGMVPVSLAVNKFKTGDNEETRVAVVVHDLRLQKQHEKEMLDRQVFLQTILDNMPVGIFITDREGRIQQVNPASRKIWGGVRFVGIDQFGEYKGWWAKNGLLVKPEEWGAARALRTGEISVNEEIEIQCFDGTAKTILNTALPIRNKEQEMLGVMMVNQDITELKDRNRELLQMAAAVEEINEPIAAVRKDGTIRYANPAFKSLHQLTGNILRKQYLDILFRDNIDPETADRLKRALRKGEKRQERLLLENRDGASIELEASLYPVRDKYGHVVSFVVVERDLTEELEFHRRLRDMQKMEALGTLAGGIAHDLNNILNPILLNTELVLFEDPPEQIEKRLQTILDAGRRGQDLVKQILVFTSHKEQTRKMEKLAPIIEEALNLVEASLPKNIRITRDIKAADAAALVDASQIHQIVLNLAGNAGHAMREQGGDLYIGLDEITLSEKEASRDPLLQPGPYLCLKVSDSGSGMPPEVRNKIFDPFFTTKKSGEGTGMGLAVVHGIVKRHNGAVLVDSEPGKGTAFRIYFPKGKAMHAGEPLAKPEVKAGTETILFVDDEEMQAATGKQVLEKLGYSVVACTSSLEALDKIKASPDGFDLVFTDQSMPGLTGIQMGRQIKNIRADLPIILSTGYSDIFDAKAAEKAGINGYLSKPYSIQEMAAKVRSVLDSSRSTT